uniref:hypothetical protein n=1 Tax=Serratia marcescens TaxID=615 RepID=UPI0011E7A4CB
MNNELLLRYRIRIAAAALNRRHGKTGSNNLVIDIPNKGLQTFTIEVSTMMALLGRFEDQMRGEYGTDEGNKTIEYAYKNAIN